MVYRARVLLPSVAVTLSIALLIAGCSTSPTSQNEADGGGDAGATIDGTPDSARGSDTELDGGSCQGLCQADAATMFSCSSNVGPLALQALATPSTCANYSPEGVSVCSPLLTTLNAQVNLNYEELDCDGIVRSTVSAPCRSVGTWSLQGDSLTLDLTEQHITATCTKQ